MSVSGIQLIIEQRDKIAQQAANLRLVGNEMQAAGAHAIDCLLGQDVPPEAKQALIGLDNAIRNWTHLKDVQPS